MPGREVAHPWGWAEASIPFPAGIRDLSRWEGYLGQGSGSRANSRGAGAEELGVPLQCRALGWGGGT